MSLPLEALAGTTSGDAIASLLRRSFCPSKAAARAAGTKTARRSAHLPAPGRAEVLPRAAEQTLSALDRPRDFVFNYCGLGLGPESRFLTISASGAGRRRGNAAAGSVLARIAGNIRSAGPFLVPLRGRGHAHRGDRHRLCRPGLRRVLLGIRRLGRLRRQGCGKIARLKRGEIPIYEPGLDQIVASNKAAGRLELHDRIWRRRWREPTRSSSPSARPRAAATAMPICPMSSAPRKRSRAALTGYTVVVTKSTVPVGTGRKVAAILRQKRPDAQFDVVSNPEFLREGSAIQDFMRPDRVVIGCRQRARPRRHARALPAALSARDADPLHLAGDRRAHQIRRQQLPRHQDLLHQRDRRSVRAGRRRCPGRGQGHRARRPHRPQIPPCRAGLRRLVLPQGLPGAGARPRRRRARRSRSSRPWSPATTGASAAWPSASSTPAAAASRGKTIAVLGLTFKPNTDDMRDSPSLAIVPALQEAGATIRAFDPEGMAEAKKLMRQRRLLRQRLRDDGGRARAGHRHRMERVPRARSRAASRRCWRRRRSSTCATSTSPRTWPRPASTISASAARSVEPAQRRSNV